MFRGLRGKNVAMWSTVNAGCAHNGKPHETMTCSVVMREAGMTPYSITMLSILEACVYCVETRALRCAHGVAVRSGLALEWHVDNAILSSVHNYPEDNFLSAFENIF